ncbi:MAG: hypothetical protein A2Y15_08410 [Clostridiales bacterium GWF2_36_10]|nr:MAG: hypothetical protein A2Y15_08410 [Clostridiales bacterium GWF2_36_10]HAN20323.1 GNAT family N-acetyltransferase [Clostridiales bacterium]
MNITYRRVLLTDAELLAKTRIEFLHEYNAEMSSSEKELLYIINKDFFEKSIVGNTFTAFLAFDGKKLVGTSGICFYSVPPNNNNISGKVAFIQNMYTLPDYRRNGIATKLFYMIIEEAKARNCKKITLNATSMGRPIYEKFGFKDTVNDMVYFLEDF